MGHFLLDPRPGKIIKSLSYQMFYEVHVLFAEADLGMIF